MLKPELPIRALFGGFQGLVVPDRQKAECFLVFAQLLPVLLA